MKPIIIVPAHNEQDNILDVMSKIKLLAIDYIVINDSSFDNTALILDINDINHIDLPCNIGIAGVVQMGFRYAVENQYDAAIVVDGDGQHPPIYIKPLLAELEKGYDYVIGSRYLKKKKPWSMRMLGSRMIGACLFIATGKKISDPTSGMRAIGKSVLEMFAKDMNYVAEPDALAYLIRKKYQINEVQIDMDDRLSGSSYFIDPIKSIKYMTSVIISILIIQLLRSSNEH